MSAAWYQNLSRIQTEIGRREALIHPVMQVRYTVVRPGHACDIRYDVEKAWRLVGQGTDAAIIHQQAGVNTGMERGSREACGRLGTVDAPSPCGTLAKSTETGCRPTPSSPLKLAASSEAARSSRRKLHTCWTVQVGIGKSVLELAALRRAYVTRCAVRGRGWIRGADGVSVPLFTGPSQDCLRTVCRKTTAGGYVPPCRIALIKTDSHLRCHFVRIYE
jgi:hypothetical protein